MQEKDGIVYVPLEENLMVASFGLPLIETPYWNRNEYVLMNIVNRVATFRKISNNEELYRVEVPDKNTAKTRNTLCLCRREQDQKIVIQKAKNEKFQTEPKYLLTEDEIRLDHEYLWPFAKQVEGEYALTCERTV